MLHGDAVSTSGNPKAMLGAGGLYAWEDAEVFFLVGCSRVECRELRAALSSGERFRHWWISGGLRNRELTNEKVVSGSPINSHDQ